MVDINLFKEEGEEEQDWKSSSEEESGMDNLDDDLGFGDELEDAPVLEEDHDLLGDTDEEEIPDFGEVEDQQQDEDYNFGQSRGRKTPVWLWVLLGAVVVGASLWMFVIQPRQAKISKMAQQVPKTPPDVNKLIEQMRQRQQGTAADSGAVTSQQPGQGTQPAGTIPGTPAKPDLSGKAGNLPVMVYAAKAVIAELTRRGQFGTVLIRGNQFYVEYVSRTAGIGSAFGKEIQNLLGAPGFQASPEEKHVTGGVTHYWGVISGNLANRAETVANPTVRQFAAADPFIAAVRDLATGRNMRIRGVEKFNPAPANGGSAVPVLFKIEGNQDQTLKFMTGLAGLRGNFELYKMTVAPVNITDLKGGQLKVALEFTVNTAR